MSKTEKRLDSKAKYHKSFTIVNLDVHWTVLKLNLFFPQDYPTIQVSTSHYADTEQREHRPTFTGISETEHMSISVQKKQNMRLQNSRFIYTGMKSIHFQGTFGKPFLSQFTTPKLLVHKKYRRILRM